MDFGWTLCVRHTYKDSESATLVLQIQNKISVVGRSRWPVIDSGLIIIMKQVEMKQCKLTTRLIIAILAQNTVDTYTIFNVVPNWAEGQYQYMGYNFIPDASSSNHITGLSWDWQLPASFSLSKCLVMVLHALQIQMEDALTWVPLLHSQSGPMNA